MYVSSKIFTVLFIAPLHVHGMNIHFRTVITFNIFFLLRT